MDDLWQFRILKYVPNPIRNEPINIGILLCAIGDKMETVHVRVTADWTRVLCIDPSSDMSMLSSLAAEFRQLFASSDRTFAQLGGWLEEYFDNSIQLSGEIATRATDPDAELSRLMALLVDPLPSGRTRG